MILADNRTINTNVLKKTEDGYLQGKLCLTGIGVFHYFENNKTIGRLRSKDEVEKSTSSLNSKPVTLYHPDEDVTPENAKKLSVGMSGTDAYFDGINCWATLTITDKSAIEMIEAGKVKAISCGYECEVSCHDGVWQGTPYSQEQKEIRYNHIALVFEGRAGDQVRFRVGDSIDGIETNKGNNNMKNIMLDGVQYQADEAVIEALKQSNKEKDSVSAQLADKQKELDSITAERDAAKSELEKEKVKDHAAEIEKLVDEKISFVEKAKSFGCEVKTSDSVDSIKKAVIAKAYSDLSLDGKSADYVSGLYDSACVFLAKDQASKKKNTSLDDRGNPSGNEKSAYEKMCDELYNESNNKKKEK